MYGIVRFASRGKGHCETHLDPLIGPGLSQCCTWSYACRSFVKRGPFFQGGIMKQIRWLQVLCLAGAAACRESTAPITQSLPSDVAQFLAPVPKLRSASTVFSVPEKGFLLF